MLDYWNLVIDHNIQTPAGASPESVYIGVQICNDGNNDMTDVFAYIGDYGAGTPGIYPSYTPPSNRPYSGTFSFTHEGGTADATRFVGDLKAGECITQYWLLSYPLMDADGVPLFGANSKTWDDAQLTYDVWATAIDNGNYREAEDSKTVTLRAQLSANANKILPNNTNQVPNQYLNAFPDKQLGWHMTSSVTHPGATVALEGNWFKLGKINKGFDNDGDFQKDFNFMIQPVGNPVIYDANCFRLVKVSGMMMIKLNNGTILEIPFEDRMHFEGIPSNNTGGVGFVVYEFAVLDGNCVSQVSPYQEGASGKNREKFNSDFGTTAGLNSDGPSTDLEINVTNSVSPGDEITATISAENTSSIPIGNKDQGAPVVIQHEIPGGTFYVGGSAETGNTLPGGMGVQVLYSIDGGMNWTTSEPTPATAVRNIQWWFDRDFQPGEDVSVSLNLTVPPDYVDPSVPIDAGLSLGNANPFLEVQGTTIVQGGLTVSGVVFLDNADGNATLGDGVQTGAEPGVAGVTVTLFEDLNENGTIDYSDFQVGQVQTSADGTFEFASLSSADYLVEVDHTDEDIPAGFVNTNITEVSLENASIDTEVSFGFAPLLEVTNTLTSSVEAFESSTIEYQVQLENLSYAEDTDNSSTVTAWSTILDAATNFDYNANDLLGPPDIELAWPNKWDNRIAQVRGFDFSGQEGEIEKVEIIISICLDNPVNNDYLEVSFLGEDGQVKYTPDPVLSKWSSPSLNDYVGPPNIGLLILDVTNYQDWDWDVFDSNWYVAMEGHKVGGEDGAHQYTDAIGVRVTSTCCASSGGEPGNPCSTITKTPMEFEYDNTQLQFVSSTIAPDNVANGVIYFDDIGSLYSNQITTIDFEFEALQPDGNPVITTATITDGETGCGIGVTDTDDSDPVTVVNLGSVTGFVYGDADGDGWQGVTGYEPTDNFIPNVEVNLYVCKDDFGNNIYPAPNKWRECTHWQNDGHWDLVRQDTTDENGAYRLAGLNNGYYYLELDETTLTNSAEQTADPDYTNGVPSPSWKLDKRWKRPDWDLRYMGMVGIGNDHVNVNFGYQVQSTISGVVFEDTNGDGVRESSENTLSYVEVEFAHAGCISGVNCPTILTNGNGEYTYNSPTPGTVYTISIDKDNIQGAENWVITAEPDGTTDNSFQASVEAGEQLFDLDVGLQPAGDLSLGGKVYFDWAGNGHRNQGDEGIPGIEVKLYKDQNGNGTLQPNDPQVGSTTTDIDGNYVFSNKPSENYIVRVEENDLPIFPKQTEDPDEYGVCTVCDAQTAIVEQSYTASITDVWNQYNYYNAGCEICDEGYTSSDDSEWIDNNLDIINFQDPIGNASACVTQVAVRFRVAASDFEKDYYTSWVNDVNYEFPIELNGVQIGTFDPEELPYWCGICEDITLLFDVDFNNIPYNFGGQNTLDVNFQSYNMTRPANQRNEVCVADIGLEFIASNCAADVMNLDFGYQPTGTTSIRGCVYQDDNGDGQESLGDSRLSGIEMRLEVDFNEDNIFHQIRSTATNANGEFAFDYNPDGLFRVVVNQDDPDIPTDYTGAPAILTGENRFDVVVEDDEVVMVDGRPGGDLCGINRPPPVGFTFPGRVLGIIYSDDNGNGVEDIYEEGIPNVAVYVCHAADGYCDATNAIDTVYSAQAVGAAPAGYYIIGGLEPGLYSIAVDYSTVPSGYTLTADPSTDGIPCYSPLQATDANYDFLLAECDNMLKTFEVTSNSEYAGVDFGYQPTGTVGDMVWYDDNEDGIVDEDEEGLEEVEVILTNTSVVSEDGTNYNPGEYTRITYTDSDGLYSFGKIPDGLWRIYLTVPTDFLATYDVDGVHDNSTSFVIANGDITDVGNTWCAAGSDCSMDLDFGLTPNFVNTLTGTVCLDNDQDGICSTGGETFPAGTSVSIFDENGTFFGQMTVGNDGQYYFDNLPNANMVVSVSKIVAPLNLSTMTTSLGDTPAYDMEDSDNNSLQFVTVSGGVTNMDFGYVFTDSFDLGDLPAPFISEVTANTIGPAHLLESVPSLYLGARVDSEEFPTLRDDAEGDDQYGFDDEDGVIFSDPATWTIGANGATVDVEVFGNGYLVGFVDFSQDGDFDDAGELAVNQDISTGTHTLSLTVPAGTDLSGGQEIFARFRLFETQPISPATASTGVTQNGEVEDYRLTVCKNLIEPGSIVGEEIGCDGYDAAEITASSAPDGGGGSLEYQWQLSSDNGVTWTDITNENGPTFDPGFILQTTRFRRGARRERCEDFVYSNIIVKSVVTNYDDPGAIVGNEENCGIYDPGLITSVIAPSGGSGTSSPEYQWQYRTNAEPNWLDITNAEGAYYDPGVISVTTEYRRGARKSPCTPFVYSSSITKMVSVNYISPGAIDGDQSICGPYDPDEITSLELPSGGVDGYEQMRWEMSVDDGATWSEISGASGETFDPGVIGQTTMYRRKARRVPCTVWVNSNVVTKTVKPFPTASIINFPVSSGYLCELTDYEYEAEDAGAGATYSWDFSGFGNPNTAVGQGPHFIQFDVPNNTVLTSANVVLTTELNGCVSTDNRTMTFRPEIRVDSVTTIDPAACSVNDGEITIHASFPTGSNVEYSVDGGLAWDTDLNFDNLGAGVYDVRVRYIGNECEERHGAVALSDPPPQADILVSSSEECTSSTIVVEGVSTVGAPVFTWIFGNGAVPNTASGPGPHSVYFTEGGFANIAVTLDEGGCIGVRDTNIAIVANFTDGGSVIGGETLCSTYDPAEITAGSNPSGGIGGTLEYQWEYRESDALGGWSNWQDLAGAVAPSLDPGLITSTTEFRRKARRAPCSDWLVSNSVIATLVTKPNLNDDTYNTVCPGFPHADNVSENDLELVNATYSLLVFPTNGVLDFEADGEFIYDPNTTFCGTDEFYYLVCNDGTGCCDTAHVVVDLTDTTPPAIVNVPDNITLSCDDQIPVADAVDVTENCQSVSLNLDEFTTKGADGCEYYNYDWVRIWNGVDYCSNSTEAQQVITIEDRTSPDIFRIYTLPNGKKMVAGVMENVSNHWKTVSFPIQFANQPVMLAQVSSQNEASPVNARLRNISTTQFQVILQEEEGADGVHTQENVSWVAFERGTFSGDDAFEMTSHLMTDAVQNFAFGETFDNVPHVFATVQTNNEKDPVNVRLTNLNTLGLDSWLQEETSSDPEVSHNLETVSLVAFENVGNVTNADGEVIGEIGTANVSDAGSSISFANKYHNPVVIISALPNGQHDPVTARVANVTETGFDVELEEWEYLDGVHAAETVSYLVVEGSLPLDQYVDCNNIPEAMTIGIEVVAVDNCDATIQLTMVESDYNFDCTANNSFTRTWTTLDECGNVTELVQTYHLLDDEPPTFTVPETVTIACDADKDDLDLTGDVNDEADNCTDDIDAVYTDNLSNVTGCGGFVIRTWTATDNCGNVATEIQHIYIAPNDDSDRDNVPDQFDLDDDNDGIPDLAEGMDDFDQDGIPNHLDLDSDNDGIPDLIEIAGKDANGDGIVDIVGDENWDFDGDGFAYGFDGSDNDNSVVGSVTFVKASIRNDRDQDGFPNYVDRDSDNDGISDLVEAGGVDGNGDGIIDYPSQSDPTSMIDIDNDGFSDTYDPDDKILLNIFDLKDPLVVFNEDEYKGGSTVYNPDFDGDMIPDFLDSDSDNDGIADIIEGGGIDTDGDGKIEVNGTFVDANNDGFKDVYVNYPLVSVQEDGNNNDGRPSDMDGNGTVYLLGDLDMDGQPNHRDHESDGDNISDIFETGLFQYDGDLDGILDAWSDTNMNGWDDLVEASTNILTEGDGLTIDGKPEDSGDADESAYSGAAADGEFATVNGTPDVDDDADNIPNFLDKDSDNDFLPDDKEDKDADGKQTPGETAAYNPDSDDDGIKDGIEDWNRNGYYSPDETDPLNPNTDGDPLLDGEEDVNFNGQVDPIESDPRNPCDPMLNDACRGLVLDVKVKIMGATIQGDTTELMRDNIRDEQFLPEFEPYSKLGHIKHVGEDVFVEIPDTLLDVGYDPTVIGGAPGYGNGVINNPFYDPTTGTINNPGQGGAYGYGYGMTNGWNGHREWCNPGMFYITGADAPVDWVLIEIRSALQPDSVVATRAGLLQRDGDIRDIDGQSYITFGNIPSGSFYVSVRHRNHLGVMTATPLVLSPDVTEVDFTNPMTPTYGDNAMKKYNDEMVLWPGDLNGDEKVIFQGPGNDVLKLFQEIILADENEDVIANYILPGYRTTDFNMDGNSIFQGPQNEKAMILIYSILGSSSNPNGLANFVLLQNLP